MTTQLKERESTIAGLITFGFLAALSLFLPFQSILSSVLLDDTFYYAQIARNLAHKGLLSFDGIHETNGFHLVWLLLITPVAYFFPEDETFIRGILLVEAIFSALAVAWMWQLLRRHFSFGSTLAATLIALLFYYTNWILICGMEGGIAIAFLFASLRAHESYIEFPSSGRLISLGVFLGLLALSRLDTALLIGAIGIELLRRKALYPAILLGILATLPLCAYLLFNLFYFDHLLPANALIKLSKDPLQSLHRFSQTMHRLLFGSQSGLGLLFLLLLLGLGIGWLIYRIRTQTYKVLAPSSFYTIGIPLGAASVTHLLLIALLIGKIYPWYLIMEVFFMVWVLCVLAYYLERYSPVLKNVFWIAVVGFVGVIWAPILYRRWYPKYRELHLVFREGAQWLEKNTPPTAKIGCFDAGIVGYFAHRRVINLDGLVNNVEFVPYARGDSVYAYIRKERIEYLAQFFIGDGFETGRLSGSKEEWLKLLGDTLYRKEFRYYSTGIFSKAMVKGVFV
ncbi:MAG: glycosyltransferase family 39 protein, partial [Bacteroidia bacterium]|nr:glycosyltransferase family 39 protein [Bacteroidia bacterium]